MWIEQPPRIYRWLFPGTIWRKPSAAGEPPCVYLTFDDGPIPEMTPWVLDTLAHYGVKATFFCVGDNVAKYPTLYRQITEQGHQVGNHTFNHIQGIRSWSSGYMENVEKAGQWVPGNLFRPPHGHMRWPQLYRLRKAHYQVIMWDVVTRDYSPHMTANGVVNVVKKYTRNGSIIVFHDSLKAKPRLCEALPRALEWLIGEGYRFDMFRV